MHFASSPNLLAFAETRCFALQIAQIVKLGAAHAAGAHDVDVIDHRSVHRENALYALAKADLSHGDGFADARVLAGNHGSFKRLQTFLVAFFDLDVDANGVARAEFRDLAVRCFGRRLWSIGGSACDKSLNPHCSRSGAVLRSFVTGGLPAPVPDLLVVAAQ